MNKLTNSEEEGQLHYDVQESQSEDVVLVFLWEMMGIFRCVLADI